MRIKETKVYTYAELSDAAKEKARDWYRGASAGDDFWHESVIDDFCEAAKALGFTLGSSARTHFHPAVYFSGFSSQGDGAAFAGSWRAADCDAARLLADRPQTYTDAAGVEQRSAHNARLHEVAQPFIALAAKFPNATGSVANNGRYFHISTEFDCGEDCEADHTDTFDDACRDLCAALYSWLEVAYDYANSDEVVAENIEANEYEFTEEGKRS